MKFTGQTAAIVRFAMFHGFGNFGEKIKPAAVIILLSLCAGGCNNKFWDPSQVGRFRPTPAVNVILDSLGVAEETPSAFAGAEEPRPSDVIAYETDYVFGPGDIVRISIFELLQQGVPFTNDYIVTETGKISIPEVGVVEAQGMTEAQLEDEIKQILSPSILKLPSVTVTLISSQKRTFTISGNGVPRPSRYSIPRYDFRLLDALATAGGISQFNISYIYISRQITGAESVAEPVTPQVLKPEIIEPSKVEPSKVMPKEPQEKPLELQREMMEIIAPRAQRVNTAQQQMIIASAEMATQKELAEVALPEGFDPVVGIAANDNQLVEESGELQDAVLQNKSVDKNASSGGGRNEAGQGQSQGRIEWIFQDGKWVPVQIGAVKPEGEAQKKEVEIPRIKPEEKIPEQAEWEQIGTGGVQTRVLKIPADKLTGGDPRYNVVIKAGDSIQVPVDIIGEFCIMGNVNSQGFIDLTGRPMTLKMAIAAAGGLGPLAWPKRCEVVRRVSKDKEEIVMVDLDKIASGEQPDFFIKPNDLINVGTHSTSRWRAVLRNAFRATYGFGFIYDRNFNNDGIDI
jgi:polysaccharide export outer membrane protein